MFEVWQLKKRSNTIKSFNFIYQNGYTTTTAWDPDNMKKENWVKKHARKLSERKKEGKNDAQTKLEMNLFKIPHINTQLQNLIFLQD